MAFLKYLDTVKQKYNFGFTTLKKEQVEVIDSVLEKKDTLALLPTNFGKSITIWLPPLILDEVSILDHPGQEKTTLSIKTTKRVCTL